MRRDLTLGNNRTRPRVDVTTITDSSGISGNVGLGFGRSTVFDRTLIVTVAVHLANEAGGRPFPKQGIDEVVIIAFGCRRDWIMTEARFSSIAQMP